MVFYNKPDIGDYRIFPSRGLQNDSVQFTFQYSEYRETPEELTRPVTGDSTVIDFIETSNTVAFLIIRNDTILFEKYFDDYSRASLVPSFSMAKPIVATLIGCAVDDGLIRSASDPITDYIPELQKRGFDKVTIEHLLQMTSGLKFNEDYTDPFADVATLYYGRHLKRSILRMKMESEPGKVFKYASGNTMMLGIALANVIKGTTVTQYFQNKLWQPLGMEVDGSWSLDRKRNGMEKTFCCINATARDFAKIGRLYLNHGNWNGKQIVSEKWIGNSIKLDTTNGSPWNYQYNWWLPSQTGDFMAHGKGGQYLYVNPAKNMIIVRLGTKEQDIDWPEIFLYIAAAF